MLAQLPTPILFAHRGSSAYAPENTLAAFKLAVEQGAEAIELDAKLCADRQVVVIHDQTVDRTTGSTGKVRELSLAALRELDAGSYFGPAFHGEKIPTLAEVFDTVGQSIYINVELTNYASPTDELPDLVAGLVERFGMQDRVLFSSFNPLALIRIHRHLPQALLGLLALPGRSGAFARSGIGRWVVTYQALHPEKGDVTPGLVERVHRVGKRVHVWTVNEAQTIRDLVSWKVDGIITDDPILAQKVIQNEVG